MPRKIRAQRRSRTPSAPRLRRAAQYWRHLPRDARVFILALAFPELCEELVLLRFFARRGLLRLPPKLENSEGEQFLFRAHVVDEVRHLVC